MFLLYGLLYLTAAGGFYTYLVRSAQVLPDEVALAITQEEPGFAPAARELPESLLTYSPPHAA